MHRFAFPIFIFFFLSIILESRAQATQELIDGRDDKSCEPCKHFIDNKPKEILFGIHVHDGVITFSITGEEWFNRMFPDNTCGIAVDLVTKEQLGCNKKEPKDDNWYMGTVTKPMYLAELKKNLKKDNDGEITINLGRVPANLSKKELEGNLVVVRGNKVCYYSNFINIDEASWELLDMGLFTDSLIDTRNVINRQDTASKHFYFTRKRTITIPFERNKSEYSESDIKKLYKSMNLKGYRVARAEIRAFSSVEGPLSTNLSLQKDRADHILSAIQSHQTEKILTEVVTAENWVEFMQSIDHSQFSYLKNLSKAEIKKRLEKKSLLDSLDSRLAKQRKAIITLYLNPVSEIDNVDDESVIDSLNASMKSKDMEKSSRILRAIFEKIADNKEPSDLLEKILIPGEKQYTDLSNALEVYKYMLGTQELEEAIRELHKIEKLSPENGKIKYNICALQIHMWALNDKYMSKEVLMQQISALLKYGIRQQLVNRMIINYNIVLCDIFMKQQNFDAKDRTLADIKKNLVARNFDDNDLLSIGKYFTYYRQYNWADEILKPRMEKLDVNEDLVFFYINLSILRGAKFKSDINKNMVLNAISINSKRFCRFYNSIDNGGVSMQLLTEPYWKGLYCDNCN
jgi:hypothetical protein